MTYQILKDTSFWLSIYFVKTDGYTPVTGVAYNQVTFWFQKENEATLSVYNLAPTTWKEVGQGLYQAGFAGAYSNVLGRFTYLASGYSTVSGVTLIPYPGQAQIVEDIPRLYNAAQLSAAYDGSTLRISVGLERNGEAVLTPYTSSYVLYDAAGTQLASGSNSSPDSNGVFRYVLVRSLNRDTVPYVHASVTDAIGTVVTRQFLPVVG